jgi:hypothetical protein
MTQPAGWYPDGHGATRYWDGSGWTEQVAPQQPSAAPSGYPQQGFVVPPGYEMKKKKRFYKRVWFWLVVVPVVFIIIIIVAVSAAVNKVVNDKHTVVYSVTGTIGKADIDYYSVDGSGNSASQSVDGQTLPFSKTITVKGDLSGFNISANAPIAINSPSGTLTCSIRVDGKVVSTDHASGSTDVVSCFGTGSS